MMFTTIKAIIEIILYLGWFAYTLWATFKLFDQEREMNKLRENLDHSYADNRLLRQWLNNTAGTSARAAGTGKVK